MNTIFVYGTLKSGFRNNHYLNGQELLGHATTADLFRMYSVRGGFPALVRDDGGYRIEGELWSVDGTTMVDLDRLEGVRPCGRGLYRRDVTTTVGGDSAAIYIWNAPTDGMEEITTGNWTEEGGRRCA